LLEQGCTVAGDLLGHAQRLPPVHHLCKDVSPLFERERPHVMAVREEHVEDVVEELAALTATEPVATRDERNRFTVDHEVVGRIRV
jgi:hypothetical protein